MTDKQKLINQIRNEIDELSEEIGKIEFGEVLIEIKNNRVTLMTYKGEKKPANKPDYPLIPLTKERRFAKIPLQ